MSADTAEADADPKGLGSPGPAGAPQLYRPLFARNKVCLFGSADFFLLSAYCTVWSLPPRSMQVYIVLMCRLDRLCRYLTQPGLRRFQQTPFPFLLLLLPLRPLLHTYICTGTQVMYISSFRGAMACRNTASSQLNASRTVDVAPQLQESLEFIRTRLYTLESFPASTHGNSFITGLRKRESAKSQGSKLEQFANRRIRPPSTAHSKSMKFI